MKITLKLENGHFIPYDKLEKDKIDKLKDGIYQIELSNLDLRTLTQNRSQWLWLSHIAHNLNSNNMYISKTIKAEVNWNKDSVKALIFDPIVNALYQKKSSTELKKDEYEKIIDTITYIFANKGISIPEFPNRNKL